MMIEPKKGGKVVLHGVKYRCYVCKMLFACQWCDLCGHDACGLMKCRPARRKDGKRVLFIREGHYSREELNEILKIIRRGA